jgi:hypothetical protein
MDQTSSTRPTIWYWIVSGLALLWMMFGVLAWVMDFMTDKATAEGFTEAQRQLYAARPGWIFVLYAIAIFSGLAGTIGLLMRKSWARTCFAISLAAVFLQFGYIFVVMDAVRLLGPAQALPFPIVIFAIGCFLLWFSHKSRQQGILD